MSRDDYDYRANERQLDEIKALKAEIEIWKAEVQHWKDARKAALDGGDILKAELDKMRAEVEALRGLLVRCRPIVESEAALVDSMARHMEGDFPEKDVWSANQSVHFLHQLLDEIDAALRGKGE